MTLIYGPSTVLKFITRKPMVSSRLPRRWVRKSVENGAMRYGGTVLELGLQGVVRWQNYPHAIKLPRWKSPVSPAMLASR
jgi:hypothetical protein